MIIKLQENFKSFKYKDSNHSYTHKDKKLLSVTQFINTLKEPFDKKYWSIYKSYEFSGLNPKYNWSDHKNNIFTLEDGTVIQLDQEHNTRVTAEEVLEQWSKDSLVGTTRGTYIHNYLECREQRLMDIPKLPFIRELDTIESIRFNQSLHTGIELANKFLEYQNENLIPVAMEYTVGNLNLGLAGRFDRLYWNINEQEYQIWDFKTDKKIGYTGRSKLKIFDISDCEFEKYSLQTSLYKHMIEEAIKEKLGSSHIVHFDIKNKDWQILETTDYTQLIKDKANDISWHNYIS